MKAKNPVLTSSRAEQKVKAPPAARQDPRQDQRDALDQFHVDRQGDRQFVGGRDEERYRDDKYEGDFANRPTQRPQFQQRPGPQYDDADNRQNERWSYPNQTRGGRWSGESERYNSREQAGEQNDHGYVTNRGYDVHDEDARRFGSSRPPQRAPKEYDYENERGSRSRQGHHYDEDHRNHDQGYRYSPQGNQGYDRDDEDYHAHGDQVQPHGPTNAAPRSTRSYSSRGNRWPDQNGYRLDDDGYGPQSSDTRRDGGPNRS